ncbi:hypothetical protein A3C20_01000 [Candidatus Kaiserbacteria bacterium RIFCSPHIGHO2_02_FULL_55_25]|uniref:N-acetyltransferase domain-containing protein n=1 Tax=Candidatus Kaiserbacteria bacterium RIFCSPHIGHO2_02_FULL_55_25 TaxID=1798498 RepID=A0A1F6E5F7_9BACT|nr:MAG: hypothetical protein A2764_03295 [Candidatus Kaiserbacteria bacterium RIFCSPHIGHO2_01_FULL_55_79]OGG68770.1 MAG: hypothetical protein A3C20_01000 [Candidatus Kaiserbacteria bacterium RIFCSPHIGHO2_02_FULL_55_25]OGG84078.1 MAG: hypothetical protein A3A42_02140 [Candidatus Kaiserbacteria bacterium RIFCSPLOWO2_01_FULL_55_25]
MNKQPLVITTERDDVLLREYVVEDADAIFLLIDRNREHLSRWGDVTSSKYPNLASVVQSIRHPVSPGRLRMGIWRRNEFVGSVNLQPLPAPYHAEVGYWLGQEYTGSGLMTTAVRKITAYAFETIEYFYLKANVRKENLPSQKVLERVGFRVTSIADVYLNYGLRAFEFD